MGGNALDKVVPQNTCRILQDLHKDRDFSGLVLDRWTHMTLLHIE